MKWDVDTIVENEINKLLFFDDDLNQNILNRLWMKYYWRQGD